MLKIKQTLNKQLFSFSFRTHSMSFCFSMPLNVNQTNHLPNPTAPSPEDKIFVGCGQSIHGFTRKGKEFVKIKTNLTEQKPPLLKPLLKPLLIEPLLKPVSAPPRKVVFWAKESAWRLRLVTLFGPIFIAHGEISKIFPRVFFLWMLDINES